MEAFFFAKITAQASSAALHSRCVKQDYVPVKKVVVRSSKRGVWQQRNTALSAGVNKFDIYLMYNDFEQIGKWLIYFKLIDCD